MSNLNLFFDIIDYYKSINTTIRDYNTTTLLYNFVTMTTPVQLGKGCKVDNYDTGSNQNNSDTSDSHDHLTSGGNDQLTPDQLKHLEHVQDCKTFWLNIKKNWPAIHMALTSPNTTDEGRYAALNVCTEYLGDMAAVCDIEFTVGEVNRMYCNNDNIVEMYISPKLLLKNVKYVDLLVEHYIELPYLTVHKYRAYNVKDELIQEIDYGDFTAKYDDLGCQYFSGINEFKEPVLNLVIYVKKDLADKILVKRNVTFVDPAFPNNEPMVLPKWLPSKVNVIDLFLLNVIGEYNLIHKTGYIEFLPEGDPLIAEGSTFHELANLKDAYQLVQNDVTYCHTCGRSSVQTKLKQCGNCTVLYCTTICQALDYETHKKFCEN